MALVQNQIVVGNYITSIPQYYLDESISLVESFVKNAPSVQSEGTLPEEENATITPE